MAAKIQTIEQPDQPGISVFSVTEMSCQYLQANEA
jgi:hypothetical protein